MDTENVKNTKYCTDHMPTHTAIAKVRYLQSIIYNSTSTLKSVHFNKYFTELNNLPLM